MPDVPTYDELYDHGKSEVQARNPELTDFNDGSDLDALTGSASVLGDEVLGVVLQLFGDQYVDTAEGAELDTLAADRFGLVRKPAVAAIGVERFTRGASSAALSIPAGTSFQAEVNGEIVTAETDSAASIPFGSTFVDVESTATVTGREGNVAAGEFDDLLDTIIGDSALTVSNLDRFAGGDEEETDPVFRDRIRRYLQTLRKGTVAALVAGAMTVPGVRFAAVDEAFVAPDDGGYVAVYVGDPDGSGNDSLAALVAIELENWRSAGIEVRVFAASREEIATAYTVTILRGADRAEITTSIRAAILAHFDQLSANQTHYASAAESAAHGVDKRLVRGVIQTTPATETTTPASPQNALRTTEGLLTLAFVEV